MARLDGFGCRVWCWFVGRLYGFLMVWCAGGALLVLVCFMGVWLVGFLDWFRVVGGWFLGSGVGCCRAGVGCRLVAISQSSPA